MNFLLDTCVISELIKPQPNPNVIEWVNSCPEDTLFLSALTIGEIEKGISKLPESEKKAVLQGWMEDALIPRFDRRILTIDIPVARKWGEIVSGAEKNGNRLPVVDSLIAATAIVNNMTVVTRNTRDMVNSGVNVFDPWG